MIAEILGRLHPLIVHLPIGILMLAFLMEIISRLNRFKNLKSSMSFILQVAILTSTLAWVTGWIMPKEGEFDENFIGWHFWTAAGMTVSTILLYWSLVTNDQRIKKLYTPLFFITIILLSLTGHFGGSLTHGEGHLFASIPKDEKLVGKSLGSMVLYSDIIQPILKKKCFGCHNSNKQKGGLDMSSISDLMNGGENGPIIIASNSASSPMIQSFHLPIEDEKHMPPKGKKQLSKNEITLIEWWIDNGASFDKRVSSFLRSKEIQSILKRYEHKENDLNLSKIEEISEEEILSIRSKGISVVRLGENSKLLSIDFARDTLLTKRKLKSISDVALNIVDLDLSYTNVDDQMLSAIKKFKNLQRLKLQNTQINSKAIAHLENLKHLIDLNLYNTKVDDKCLTSLAKIGSLKSLFVWQSEITQEAIQSFITDNPLINIQSGIDANLFGDASLKPPIIVSDKNIFTDSATVEMSLNFKNIDIFYTLDGSKPDTTSRKYLEPLVLKSTTIVKAISFKHGWNTSEIAEKIITKKGFQIKQVKLKKAPNPKYAAQGAPTLIDDILGSVSFSDGSWLGYQAEDMSVTLDLGSRKITSSAVVGALEDINSYIFYPKAMDISSSIDGKSFAKLTSINVPVSKEPSPSAYKSFILQFEPHEARYVKLDIYGVLNNPKWHVAPDAENWLFIDEIIIN
jgi:uncharacterized membrane protein